MPSLLAPDVVNSCPSCGEQFDAEIAFCPNDGAQLLAARPEDELIGTLVADRYRVTSLIGGGGMGQVYKAEHIRMKRQCAIKVLRGSLLSDPDALLRFQREAENASQLSHPHVAQIYDFGEHGKVVYLAMEYIDGESLAGLLQRQPAIHPDVAADIISQSASALEAAHQRGVLHRDVKPDNIMLAKHDDGTYFVKLVDFGIARAMTSDAQRVTKTGLVIGTPEFMSPEQLSGEELDARSDMYALGLVAFQCLTGKDAFPAGSSKQNLIMRLTSRPQALADVRADVPWSDALQGVFDRALAPDPDDRYDSILRFAEELSQAISDMTPTQTAELYRKALEQRVASVASRTPHSAQRQAATGPRADGSRSTDAGAGAAGAAGAAVSAGSRPTAGTASGGDVSDSPTVAQAPLDRAYAPNASTAPSYTTGVQGAVYASGPATGGQINPATGAPASAVGGTQFGTPIQRQPVAPLPQLRRRRSVAPWLLLVVLGGWGYVVLTGQTEQARALFDRGVAKLTGVIRSAQSDAEVRNAAQANSTAPDAPAQAASPSRAARGEGAASNSANNSTNNPGTAPVVDSSAVPNLLRSRPEPSVVAPPVRMPGSDTAPAARR